MRYCDYQRSPCSRIVSTSDIILKFCKNCPGCIRHIGRRAVIHHQNKILEQDRKMLTGNDYQIGPFQTFRKLPLGFSGMFLGFDSNGYAYIRHLDNEEALKQEYRAMQAELKEFYCFNKNLRPFRSNADSDGKLCVGELYAFELKPQIFMRTRIICVSKGSNVILVVNVDTGKIYEAEALQLYQTGKIFFKLPFKVIRCKLFDLESHLGTDTLDAVWKKMAKKVKHFKMTIIEMDLIPSIVIQGEDSITTLNAEILQSIEKYRLDKEEEARKENVNISGGMKIITKLGADGVSYRIETDNERISHIVSKRYVNDVPKPESRNYPGSAIEFFPNNCF